MNLIRKLMKKFKGGEVREIEPWHKLKRGGVLYAVFFTRNFCICVIKKKY